MLRGSEIDEKEYDDHVIIDEEVELFEDDKSGSEIMLID